MADNTDQYKNAIREQNAQTYLCDNDLYKLIGIKGNEVISQYTIKQLSGMDWRALVSAGFTDSDAIKIVTFCELARRLESYREENKPKINSPEDVYRLLYPHFREYKQEEFWLLCLDTKNQIISKQMITRGSLNANIVHPREVFKSALLSSAAHIIVSHNHPSGDPTPSREDIEITKKLTETGKIMGIDVLDHIIIGDGRHFSMKEAGYI